MKKILSVFCIATLLFASCSDEYDDSKLWQNVNGLKDRIASLEKTVQTMNSDIGSIQSIIDAINARDYIVKVDELADKSGYTITFAKGHTITIKHGKDGINGKDSPIIGIDIYEGVYYWTITTNGTKTWLVDNDGNRLKVSGVDGKTAFDLAVEKGYKGTLEQWLESLKGSNGSNGSDGQDGSNGKSAYELAVENGYTGTIEEWLLSLNGTNGSNGKSAYELAVEKGYKGTLEQWLESLKGSNGSDGQNGQDGSNGKSAYELAVENGYTGTIQEWLESLNGTNGLNGKSAYELAVEKGYKGTLEQWLESLKGSNGSDGQDGSNGKSAYELAVDKGYTGTLEEWLLSLNGTNGSNGKSAYELAVEKGYKGTLEQWLESLKGSNGSNGSDGQDGYNGKSAYELAVENGYTGTIEEWLESLNGTNGKDGSDGENGKDGITPILGIDSDGYWTINMGNGVQRLKDANGNDVKAIGQDGTDGTDGQNGQDGKDGIDGSSFFNNVRYDENYVYFTFMDGKTVSIPLSKGVSFTVTGVSAEQSFEYGETRTFNVVQNNIAKISISKPDGWRVSVHGDVLTVIAPPQENTFAEENGEIAITAMGTDSKSFILFSFAVKVEQYIQFEDSKFEEYILANFDIDGNGFLSQSEANEITNIDCSSLEITSIREIQYFPNLVILNCRNNKITTLDITSNQQLEKLNCNNNLLSNLNIDNNSNLIYANFNGQNPGFDFEVGTFICYNSHKGIAFLETYSDAIFSNWSSRMIALDETIGDHTTYMNLANNPTYTNYAGPEVYPLIPVTKLYPVKDQVNKSLQFLGKPILSGIYWYNGWDYNYGWNMNNGTYTKYSSSTIHKIRLSYYFPLNYK